MFWNFKKERDELRKENLKLKLDNEGLRWDIEDLKTQASVQQRVSYYPSTDDPSPLDEQERAAYIASVVTFFENIGLKKLGQLTARAKEDLANPLNNRDYDLAIKGTINAFAQMHDWYDEAFAEMNQPKQDKVNENQ